MHEHEDPVSYRSRQEAWSEALLLAPQQHTMAAKTSAAKVEWFIGKGFMT